MSIPPKIEVPQSVTTFLEQRAAMHARLTEKKAADRLTMARELVCLCRLAAPMRVLAEIIMDAGGSPKRVDVRIAGPATLSVRVEFEGDTPHPVPNTFVLAWYIDNLTRFRECKIAEGFAQDMNRHHFHKATDVVRGFPELLQLMATRLLWMENGIAVFDPGQD